MKANSKLRLITHKIWFFTKKIFRGIRFLLLWLSITGLIVSAIADLLNPTSQKDYASIIFAIVVITAIIETGAQRLWPRHFFRMGIPIASWHYSFHLMENLPTDFAKISGTVRAQRMLPQVILKQLSMFEYGLWANEMAKEGNRFRRKSRYNPLTRGYLYLSKAKMRLELRTYLNLTTILFLLFWFVIVIYGPSLFFKAIFVTVGIVIFGLLFRGELQQYRKAWNVVKRYAYGEIEVGDVTIELAKTNNHII